MTNGEKLEQVFPDGICPFSKSWLDYEYKEPKNKLSSGTRKNSEKLENVSPIIDWNNCHTTEQLGSIATTKNDLGVDAVSRQAINGYIDYILSHGMGKKKSFDFIKKFVAKLPPITPQEPKSEWQKDHAILKAYSDGANEVLGKIRAEIDKIYNREGNSFDCLNALDELKEFIDKYKAESEVV